MPIPIVHLIMAGEKYLYVHTVLHVFQYNGHSLITLFEYQGGSECGCMACKAPRSLQYVLMYMYIVAFDSFTC